MAKEKIEHRQIEKSFHLPGVGLRMIKTVVAVFICLLLSSWRGENAMPFYAAIATILCLQPYIENSVTVALNRVIGTIIGALYGCIIIMVAASKNFNPEHLYYYFCIALMIVPVIYTTLLCRKKDSVYIACVVFLSVTVIPAGEISPFMFALQRVIDTLMGIGVALAINILHIPRRKNRKTLFISALDETLVTPGNTLTDYSTVLLNQMLADGMEFTISTARTPASLMEPMVAVDLKLPVIVANGALLFDLKKKKFVQKKEMDYETAYAINLYLQSQGLNAFITVVVADVLLIYHGGFNNAAEQLLYEEMRLSPYRNYIRSPLPTGRRAIYLMLLLHNDELDSIVKKLERQSFAASVYIFTQASEFAGFSYLKIYDKDVSRRKMMNYLKDELGLDNIVTFGSIAGMYDVVVEDGDTNSMVRTLKRRFEPYFWQK